LRGLETWLQARLDDNVDEWHVVGAESQCLSLRGQADFTFDWEDTRSRADTPLPHDPIDEQVRAALEARPLHVALTECACSHPNEWLRPVSRKALPDYEFRHTRIETCDSCRGRKTVNCGSCSATGRVTCKNCSGNRQIEVLCKGCGGPGYFPRTRTGPNNETEHYRDTCWGCGGRGRVNETCRPCRGSGEVDCDSCGGSGQITCSDCRGRGSRLYLYVRQALVDGRSTPALDTIEFVGWADIVRDNWSELVARGAVAFSDVRAADEPAGAILRIDFAAAANAARASVHAKETKAALHAVGSDALVVEGEPLLARALHLPETEDGADWVALTDSLAGKRLLREAIDVTEDRAADHKGKSKEAYQEAQSAEIRAEMMRRYGALLGPAGASALAHIVMRGIEPLKNRVTRTRWRKNLGVAASLGLAAALVIIAAILQQEEVNQTWFKVAAQILMGTAVAGTVWGVAGHWLVRRDLQRVSEKLDLLQPLTPPRHGWPRRGGIIAALLTIAVAAALPFVSWKAGVPNSYARVFDRQIEFADGPAGEMTLPEAVILYRWPDTTSERIAEIPAKATIQLSKRANGEWRLVRFEGRHGYIRSSALDASYPDQPG
jgi:hypothetical protein